MDTNSQTSQPAREMSWKLRKMLFNIQILQMPGRYQTDGGDRRCNRRVHEGQWRFPGLKPTPELTKRNKVKSDEGVREKEKKKLDQGISGSFWGSVHLDWSVRHRRRLRISLISSLNWDLAPHSSLSLSQRLNPKEQEKGAYKILMRSLRRLTGL